MAIADFASEDALLAHSWEGVPLSREHGGPVRLIVPHLYFWKSAKWLKGIVFAADDERGFWEVRGYHNHADPWLEERYSDREDQS
jgi:DMSO/TMAO reductase YedYZ molybdopterin-dependent catalytic subunit